MTPRDPAPRAWPVRTELAWTAAFWLGLGVLFVAREAARPWRESPLTAPEALGTLAEYGLWALATPVVFWAVARRPAGRGAWAGPLAVQAALAGAAALAVEAVTRGLLPELLPTLRPPRPGGPWTLGGAVRGLWFLDEAVVALGVVVAGYARVALADARARRADAERSAADAARAAADRDRAEADRQRAEAESARLAGQLADARLGALRAQLHPHFLFNTLNAVSALVERDPEGVQTLVARLSSLLRRVLEVGDAAEVPLRDEVAFARDYLDVQRVRFQGRLATEEDVAVGALGVLVPPLVLQPLVENAVQHGVGRIEDGVGTVRVSAHVGDGPEGRRLVLAVEDDGPGLDGPAERPGGVGVANTRARLDALYGDAARLTVGPRAGGGVRAEVVLPYRPAGAARAPGDAAAQPVTARA